MNTAWVTIADYQYYHHIAKLCLPSWDKLPGEKFLITDLTETDLPHMTTIAWDSVKNHNSVFLKNCKSNKAYNFWKKMQAQNWALCNLTGYDFVVLMDSDIESYNFDPGQFENILWSMRQQGLMWATSHRMNHILSKESMVLDAGIIIFDLANPNLRSWRNAYQQIWESGAIYYLPHPYDGDAVICMMRHHPSLRFGFYTIGKGQNFYPMGFMHWGSGVGKQRRRTLTDQQRQEVIHTLATQYPPYPFHCVETVDYLKLN